MADLSKKRWAAGCAGRLDKPTDRLAADRMVAAGAPPFQTAFETPSCTRLETPIETYAAPLLFGQAPTHSLPGEPEPLSVAPSKGFET